MENVIKLINSERKEIGRLTVRDGRSMDIDLATEFAYMEENMKKLGEAIREQETLPLRTVRKEDARVMVMQEHVGKDDDNYVNAIVEYINSNRMIVPRIFAVLEKNDRRQ